MSASDDGILRDSGSGLDGGSDGNAGGPGGSPGGGGGDGINIDIVGTVVDELFRPLFRGFFLIPAALVGAVGWVFLGGDRALTSTVQGFPGLADIPILLKTWLIGALEPIGSSFLAVIREINVSLVTTLVNEGGALAPVLLTALQAVELGILVYVLWAGWQLVGTVPYVGPPLTALTTIVTRPIRELVGVFR